MTSPSSSNDSAISEEDVSHPIHTTYDSLCQTCRRFVNLTEAEEAADLDLDEILVTYDVLLAAGQGCALCQAVYRNISLHGDEHSMYRTTWQRTGNGNPGPQTLATLSIDGVMNLLIEYSSNPGFQIPSKLDGDKVGSGPSWDHLLRWLDQCREHHSLCNPVSLSDENTWLPTRLIDVGHRSDKLVKVIEASTIPDSVSGTARRYMTLSHRWHNGQVPKLASNTIERYMDDGVQLSDLRQNFVDAIHVCRQLGVQYLWIDSLCIVQDSPSDWKRESTTMCDVYSRSYLNLASTMVTHLLFQQREVPPGTFSLLLKDGPGGHDILLHNKSMWSTEVEQAPLQRRGWVVQERMLAPRVVHFGESQLFWECEQLQACEVFPQGVTSELVDVLGKSLDPMTFRLRCDTRDHNSLLMSRFRQRKNSLSAYELWFRLIERYTSCRLTQETDILVAIAGLARRMANTLNDRYIAGIWQSILIESLGWRVHASPRRITVDSPYLAPSWSWASTRAEIKYQVWGARTNLAKVKNVIVTPADGHDEFGAVGSGALMLQGNLFGGLWFNHNRPEMNPYTDDVKTSKGLSLKGFDIDPDKWSFVAAENPVEVYFLPTAKAVLASKYHIREGLLLIHAQNFNNDNRPVFRRFGWCSIREDTGSIFAMNASNGMLWEKIGISVQRNIDITIV